MLQVLRVSRELKAFKGVKEFKALRVHKDQQARLVLRVQLVLLAFKVH